MADRGSNADRVITLGCRLNLYESEVIQNHLDENPTGAQRIVVNTCAVTAEAERQAGQAIRRAAAKTQVQILWSLAVPPKLIRTNLQRCRRCLGRW